MGLSRLAEKCRACPFMDKCKNKRMEALAYLPEPVAAQATQPLTGSAIMPIAREVVERHAYGEVYVQYKDELKKELEKALYESLYKGLYCDL